MSLSLPKGTIRSTVDTIHTNLSNSVWEKAEALTREHFPGLSTEKHRKVRTVIWQKLVHVLHLQLGYKGIPRTEWSVAKKGE